ncbi:MULTISPECIES: (2,3-dihydroxybenzoyl)adenylate synthase [unclassified Streptomyces]|uniref:(2,3-dihydroxybenzoyl)adenylate synthase n=1 Tax=unclassified Streptomyces TaxID=2593676 RepID=UPI0022549E48|nr:MULTISPECIES: AMP-binding protein [unclassified Streptomyces]MCX4793322.1 AMP-binding protein [Streptomyces sp. NBC_01242]WSJ34762.1 AMP-binding protein [Streptomyces sp. NBC_01321]WSP61204.1 AMP-binding protein [Streptomyces sp. NBC_01240]WSU20276.1 AMP-binding protein [Streptomyces sp. NBC_01108]
MDVIGWPDAYARRYREAGYWQDRPLGDFLAEHARTLGDRTALVTERGSVGYAELDRRAAVLARGLADLGLARGDRVVVQLPNTEDFFAVLFAVVRIGAVPVLGLPAYRRSEAVHLARHSSAAAYVLPDTDPSSGYDYRKLADEVTAEVPTLRHVLVAGDPGPHTALADVERAGEQAPEPTGAGADPTAPAVLLVSGGTTGLPKLIPRTHNDYAYNIRASVQVCGFGPDTVYLAALPVAHNFALACPGALGTLLAGGTVVLAPSPDPDTVFPLIERHKVTATAVVPPLAALWSQAAEWAPEDLGSLALLQVGGARLSPDVARRVRTGLGCELQQVFGMAEGLLCLTRPGYAPERVDTTQGRPLCPDDELRVVGEDDHDVLPGGTGELLTRGPYTLRGYYRAPEHNRTAFTADGFYRTGDLVRLTADGDIVVEGRKKDLVNRGGDKVSADELEGHLRAHPDILDAAVVPVPDEYLGERTCAWVVPRGGRANLEVGTLDAFLEERGVAQYKKPDLVRLVDALPVTSVGKVDKRSLARRAAEAGDRPQL